jgi:prepilin peptidase CpaA
MTPSYPPPAIVAALLITVIAAAMFDMRSRRIPNGVSVAGALMGIGLNAFLADSASGAWFALKGLLLGFGVYFVLYLLRAMGAGDVKLMGAVGSLVGPANWFAIFIITAIVGGAMGLLLVLVKGRLKSTLFNVGFILSEMKHGRPAYLAREELDVKSKKALGLPHGAVIAVGSIFFLALSARVSR